MTRRTDEIAQRLVEAEATIQALLSGQIDAVADVAGNTPILLSKAQEALRASEERYRQIVDSTSEGIVKLDAGGVVRFANQRFAEMLDYSVGELTGRHISSFMPPASRAISQEGLARRRTGARDTVELSYLRKDGTEVAVSMACSPDLDEKGGYVGALAFIRDVTEQKNLVAQLMVSDRMASVGTLAAGVAHEINNPLAVVVANLNHLSTRLREVRPGSPALDTDDLEHDFVEAVTDALEAVERVRVIVRDLRLFSRSAPDEMNAPVDVRRTIESSLRMAANEIRHRARLVEVYGDVPPVAANEARLGQVLLNLLVNAAQALPEGRLDENEIRVTTRCEGSRVVIEVLDTGPGIPPAILGRIFDAFFTTKPVGVGTGLGLAISHRIVTGLGGELTVESAVGTGTTFRVSLPIAKLEERPAPPSVVSPERPSGGRRGRILVVDDDEMILRSVRRILSPRHDLELACSGADALALLARGEKFDVILCDLMMPKMTGMDVHRILSSSAPDQAKRMIFVTGGAFTDEANEFLDHRRSRIDKPFEADELEAVIQRQLASHEPAIGST